jgi:hypothetical protein
MPNDKPQTAPEMKVPNYFVSFGAPQNHANYLAMAIAEVIAPGDMMKAKQLETLLVSFATAIRQGECS